MAKYDRSTVINRINEIGLIPIFYHADTETAVDVIDACLEAGVSVVEFTNRGDNAHQVFSDLLAHYKNNESLILGTGSIVDHVTAGLYIQIGANFIVSPLLNQKIAEICNLRKIAYIPGCGSATEISQAEGMGVEFCKYFPGEVGGPAFVRNIRGPMPWTRLIPTGVGAVEQQKIADWFIAGAAAVGLGSSLIKKENINKGDFDAIRNDVKQALGWVQSARSQKTR